MQDLKRPTLSVIMALPRTVWVAIVGPACLQRIIPEADPPQGKGLKLGDPVNHSRRCLALVKAWGPTFQHLSQSSKPHLQRKKGGRRRVETNDNRLARYKANIPYKNVSTLPYHVPRERPLKSTSLRPCRVSAAWGFGEAPWHSRPLNFSQLFDRDLGPSTY